MSYLTEKKLCILSRKSVQIPFFSSNEFFFFKMMFLSVETVVVGSFKQNECGVRSAQWAYGPHCRTVVVPLIATMYLPNIDNQSGMQWTLNANIVWYIYSMHHSIMLAINSIQCLVTLTYLFQSVALYSLPPSWNEKAVVDSQLIFQPLFEILNLILFEYSSVVYCQELPSSHHINQSKGGYSVTK